MDRPSAFGILYIQASFLNRDQGYNFEAYKYDCILDLKVSEQRKQIKKKLDTQIFHLRIMLSTPKHAFQSDVNACVER